MFVILLVVSIALVKPDEQPRIHDVLPIWKKRYWETRRLSAERKNPGNCCML